jgi:hypothetical protein
VDDETSLQHIDEMPYSSLKAEFRGELEEFIEKVL